MFKTLKVSLIALALAGTTVYASEGYEFQMDADQGQAAGVVDGMSTLDPFLAYRPGRPDWRPGRPGRPDYGRQMHSCVARDFRGRQFFARGFGNVNRVAREALRSCRYGSPAPRSCRVIGCR